MFREMRRKKQQLTNDECMDILRREKRGVLSLLGDDGYPYGVPLDHWYCEDDGKLYFHGAKEGHKVDAMARCSKASYCVIGEGVPREGDWSLDFKSVIVFGRVAAVENEDKKREICERLMRKFTDDEARIALELKNALPRVRCFALTPEHIAGKRVNES